MSSSIKDVHGQNDVLECLEDHEDDLSEKCEKQIYRLAELSADDYHLDRPLYYACRDDRERFCSEVAAGEGRVYKCLMKHKFEETMSAEVCTLYRIVQVTVCIKELSVFVQRRSLSINALHTYM